MRFALADDAVTHKAKAAGSAGLDLDVEACLLDAVSVYEPNEKGTPLHLKFQHEDWLVFCWIIQHHLLAGRVLDHVGFLADHGLLDSIVVGFHERSHGRPMAMKSLNFDEVVESRDRFVHIHTTPAHARTHTATHTSADAPTPTSSSPAHTPTPPPFPPFLG